MHADDRRRGAGCLYSLSSLTWYRLLLSKLYRVIAYF